MATQDTTAASEWMQEVYTQKEYFRPFQEDYTPLLTDLEECPDEPVLGKRWNVPLYMATGYNVRTGAEGGDPPDVDSDSEIQGQVSSQEFKGAIRLTELLTRQGKAGVHFNGGALNHQMKQVTSDLTKHMQIMFWGHGTGRLAVVDETAAATLTVKLRLPWAGTRVRRNMRLDEFTLDTGGASVWTNIKVTKVDRTQKGDSSGAGYNTFGAVITLASAQNVTAGEGLYLTGDYGLAPNGIDGLIGSEALAPNFLGKSRASNPDLNTIRFHNSGTPRDLTMDLMQQISDAVWAEGFPIDQIRGNAGMLNSYANLHIADKRYPVVSGSYPKLIGGFKEGDLLFAYDKVEAVLRKDPQCTARTFKFLALKETFYKHTTAELGFLNRGGNILLPMPAAVAGRGYAYSVTARVYAAANISSFNPRANATAEDFRDATVAGD